MLLIKVEKKMFVFIHVYCTEQLNLKNISYWHYFTTKIMSICPIWNFTLYVTQSLHFFENHPIMHFWIRVLAQKRIFKRHENTHLNLWEKYWSRKTRMNVNSSKTRTEVNSSNHLLIYSIQYSNLLTLLIYNILANFFISDP